MTLPPAIIVQGIVLCVFILVQWSYLMIASVVIIPYQKSSFQNPKLFSCVQSTKGGKRYGSNRDCNQGQGPLCTKQKPCTPCDEIPLKLESWGGYVPAIESCTACSISFRGECGFEEDVGPYCNISGTIRPCEKCCAMNPY